jgi:NADH-quinone oxidoreductase subunit M
VIPAFSALFLIVSLSSLGLPGLNGFVGEFLILVGAFQVSGWLAALATTGIIFAAVYLLWMYQRVVFGEVRHEANRRLTDLTPREWAVLAPVLLLIVWIGVYPTPFTGKTEAAVQALIAQVQIKASVAQSKIQPRVAEAQRSQEPELASRSPLQQSQEPSSSGHPRPEPGWRSPLP